MPRDADDPPPHRIGAGSRRAMMVRDLGFAPDDLRGVMLKGIDAAFLPRADQRGLHATLTAEFDRLRAEPDMST